MAHAAIGMWVTQLPAPLSGNRGVLQTVLRIHLNIRGFTRLVRRVWHCAVKEVGHIPFSSA